MAYADLNFYKTEYFGNAVPDDSFQRLSERASEKIDALTSKRLRNWMPESEDEQKDIKKACCAIAESLFYTEKLTAASMGDVNSAHVQKVASITSGSESISYRDGMSSQSLEVIQGYVSNNEQDAISYLSGIKYKDTGYTILYRGYE